VISRTSQNHLFENQSNPQLGFINVVFDFPDCIIGNIISTGVLDATIRSFFS